MPASRTALIGDRDATDARENTGRDDWLTLLSVRELADILRTSPKAIYSMAERGQLPAPLRIGRRMLWPRSDLVTWLADKRAVSPTESRR